MNQTQDFEELKKEEIVKRIAKTGFQAKYMNPYYRSIFLDRQAQSFPTNRAPPPQEQIPPSGNQQQKKESQKLEEMVHTSEKPLLQLKTVFPFVFFTNEVIIDINKIVIIFRNFFASEQVHSVLIRDVSDVVVETSLFFACLKIIDIGYTDNTIDINYLKKSDGQLARRVIQGLVMAHKHGIDLSKVNQADLLQNVESLGTNIIEEE